MEVAKAQICRLIKQKMYFWEEHPWLMASMAHPSPEQARIGAQKCLKQFDDVNAPEHLHHRIAWQILPKESRFRPMVEAIANGDGTLVDVPELLERVGPWAFAPVVERTIETEHAIVHRQVACRKVGGPYVANVLRMGQTKTRVKECPPKRKLLEDCFDKARHWSKMSKHFGLDTHPETNGIAELWQVISKECSESRAIHESCWFCLVQLGFHVHVCEPCPCSEEE